MRKNLLTQLLFPLFFFGAFVGALYLFVYIPRMEYSSLPDKREIITLKGKKFVVGIADTDELRTQGLSGTSNLYKNEGLLFIFDSSDFHGFWMKDMNYSIDILWFDESYVLVDIEESVSPETYPKIFTSDVPAQYVLEVQAGTVERLGLARGEKFIWKD